MVAQYGIKLAVQLISSHFGDLVAKVCECLLRKGTLILSQVIRYTELPPQDVKKCLLVLIQHNCVQAFAMEQQGGFGEASKVLIQYTVLFDNILHRMRFPKFLVIVSEELGKECEEILEGLLQHGRLTLQQVLDRSQSNKTEARVAIQESFMRLVNACYVERCPAHEPFLALPTEEETPARKRGAKSAKIVEESETLEQRAIAAAAPMEAKRFLVITDTVTNVNEENSGDNPPSITVGEKRKHSLEMDGELGDSESQGKVIWRANFEEFVRRLRHKACIANVRSRLDDGAAIVLNAVLEATRSTEKKVKTEHSAPISLNTIYEEVMKSEAGRTMTLDHVRASLVQLGCGKRGTEDLYSIDLKNIIELAQNDEVESIVLKRYGREAYRMFRLLSKTGRLLETDKISDTTFVEKKDTAKILYKLWKDEYLHMEKVLLPAARQSQFLLWKVNKQTLWVHVLDEMYHAALNLSQRVVYELEQENELLQLPKDKLVGGLENRYLRLIKVRTLLQSSLMKLDDALMLFHDF